MLKVVFAEYYQENTKFSLFEKTNGEISDRNKFWWLIENLIKYQVRTAKFDFSRNVNIFLQINNDKYFYVFYETHRDDITVRKFLFKNYTLRLDKSKGYVPSSGLTKIEPYINYIEWSAISQDTSFNPLINVPM